MNIRAMSMGVAVLTLAGMGSAAAQSVYVERITPAPVYVAPSNLDGYVIEQRAVPATPTVTYEQQVVTPRVLPQERVITERRVVTTKATRTKPAQRIVTERRIITEPRIVTQQPLPITPQPTVVTTTQPTIVTTTEPRVVMPADDATTFVNDGGTTGLSSCAYDSYGRMICN